MSQPSAILWITEQVRTKLAAAAWSVFLFFGGLIFLLYFAHISFIPELELSSSIAVFAAAAITGAVYLVGFSVAMIAPGMIWLAVMLKIGRFRSLFYRDSGLMKKYVLVWLIAPLFVILWVFLASLIADRFGGYKPGTQELNFWSKYENLLVFAPALAFLAAAWLVLTLVFFFKERKRVKEEGVKGRPAAPGKTRLLLGSALVSLAYWVLYALSCLCFALPWLLTALIVRRSDNLDDNFLFTVLFVLFLLMAAVNLLVTWVSNWQHASRWRVTIGVAASFLVLLFLEWTVSASSLLMNVYGLGHMPHSFVVLKPEGCALLQHVGLGACGGKEENCRLDNVYIYSRLGASYFLRAADRNGKGVDFTLPKEYVLSWGSAPGGWDEAASYYDYRFRTEYEPIYSMLIDTLGGCGSPDLLVAPKPLKATPDEANALGVITEPGVVANMGLTGTTFMAEEMLGRLPARYRRLGADDYESFFGGLGSGVGFRQKYPGAALVALSKLDYYDWEKHSVRVAYKYFRPDGASEFVLATVARNKGVWVITHKQVLLSVRER